MNMSDSSAGLRDNGRRRSGIDQRQFSFSSHIPERRLALEKEVKL